MTISYEFVAYNLSKHQWWV